MFQRITIASLVLGLALAVGMAFYAAPASAANVVKIGVFDLQRAMIRNRKIGFVFQFHHLLPEFNALENAAMPALISKMGKREAYNRAEAILNRVGLSDRLKHRVGELSGGEQQRVALARSLVLGPELLLADEPTGNLDSRTGGLINELLLELNEEKGLTSVIVTHNLELANRCP